MFRDFLYFLEKAQISPFQVTTVIILALMEQLHQKGLSQTNISNHMAAIRPMFIICGLNTSSFKDDLLQIIYCPGFAWVNTYGPLGSVT